MVSVMSAMTVRIVHHVTVSFETVCCVTGEVPITARSVRRLSVMHTCAASGGSSYRDCVLRSCRRLPLRRDTLTLPAGHVLHAAPARESSVQLRGKAVLSSAWLRAPTQTASDV